ncbi:MAG TPA: cytochrome c oxidase subunit II [Gemmatimonadales bacterium]|nr:cytochrome c oxidase subunit II [Gemmatimonadales bacterium]
MRSRGPWLATIALAGCAESPSYLRTAGIIGDREARLGWVLLVIASAVVVVIAVLVLAAVYRRRSEAGTTLVRSGAGVRWIVVGGVVVPAVILLGVLFFSTATFAAVARPPSRQAVTVQVIGHRWWWEVRYAGDSVSNHFVTANELHIPVGRPVRLELATADVIHSFWVPQLAGKTDLIPGQRNVAWIEADRPGRYWGHCGEYCGLQHANMMLTVVAESPAEFARWAQGQRQPARVSSEPPAQAGAAVFSRSACSLCHTVRGSGAGGALGPDLTHLASRGMIGAGLLPNTRGHLAGWVANPQALKPGVLMPAVPLSPTDLTALLAYLESLH